MLIQEMTHEACIELLERTALGRLACSRAQQPYIVPFTFAYDSGFLYSFSLPGRKIDCMRVNPLVCVAADEITNPREWKSVVASGRYEELPDTFQWKGERTKAWELIQRTPNWWQPGSLNLDRSHGAVPPQPVWYRILLAEITGRYASEPTGTPIMKSPEPTDRKGWMANLFHGKARSRPRLLSMAPPGKQPAQTPG
jgi:nitroimidazol reductase NimA-like FMN-containing flavoprotein (pyridoxamine 5'-phosphate oxidase superfamily)